MLSISILILLVLGSPFVAGLTEQRRIELRDYTKEMFYHGFDNYMKYAFPKDELDPIQCVGRGRDKQNPQVDNIIINDVLGDFSLTLVDSLDTFVILGDKDRFENAIRLVIDNVSFDVDSKIQVFEVNIRVLGALLSAHLFATDKRFGFEIDWYKGELLEMAYDLGERLLPAFAHSKTGIPYPRVNLKYGLPKDEIEETCTAGAGSLILEFGTLSRLTNDTRFENAAKKALYALWNRRTELDLVGNVIDIQTGYWIHVASGVGAGIDSFFEYLLKAYALFGEEEYYEVFLQAYTAIKKYIRDSSGYLYQNINMHNRAIMSSWVDSLAAYFPGLQVLAGDVENAIKLHLLYYNIWKRYHALPERFNYYLRRAEIASYPLRPEFIESTYFLYRATRNPFYLSVGEMVLNDLELYRTDCGYASVENVLKGKLDPRMESFLLSETFKYLYLLFDIDNKFNTLDSNVVFTTEAHILTLSSTYLKFRPSILQNQDPSLAMPTCPRYIPQPGLLSSILDRPDADYARVLVGLNADITTSHARAYCESVSTSPLVVEVNFGERLPQNYKPMPPTKFDGGVIVDQLIGIKLELTMRSDRNGYDISKVDDYRIAPGEVLEIRDPSIKEHWLKQQSYSKITLRLYRSSLHDYINISGVTAAFSPPVYHYFPHPLYNIHYLPKAPYGCSPYLSSEKSILLNSYVIVKRGECTFYEKAIHAQDAGARAVIVVSDENHLFQPVIPSENSLEEVKITCVLVTKESGDIIERALERDRASEIKAILLPPETDMDSVVGSNFRLAIYDHVVNNVRLNLNGQ
ncbi:8066_t:CDS:10 [Paraglomus occultum]|uniref:alpha-1,2-Mannosidase n=1 Tax=Paraglomus occultum TaxID=144539 RepID=A0A9N9EZ87_9GLOM|nr:8066_t:CDS:10 [Paraglomus occultum]